MIPHGYQVFQIPFRLQSKVLELGRLYIKFSISALPPLALRDSVGRKGGGLQFLEPLQKLGVVSF